MELKHEFEDDSEGSFGGAFRRMFIEHCLTAFVIYCMVRFAFEKNDASTMMVFRWSLVPVVPMLIVTVVNTWRDYRPSFDDGALKRLGAHLGLMVAAYVATCALAFCFVNWGAQSAACIGIIVVIQQLPRLKRWTRQVLWFG